MTNLVMMSKHLIIQCTYANTLNQVCADLQLMCAWLLNITFLVEVGVCVCVHAWVCMCMFVFVCMCVCVCVCVRAHTHTRVYTSCTSFPEVINYKHSHEI